MAKGKIEVGDTIPNFELKDSNGEVFKVNKEEEKKRVIYFYPKDNTKVCTEQACSFRDWQDDFIEKGYEVIGISSDSVDSHAKFKAKNNLNFTLLSDPKNKVAKLFGATILFGLMTGRKTFVIDTQGKVKYIYDSLMEGKEHVEKLLKSNTL